MEARLTEKKLLGEFLLEQQEPFALETFLLERGCSRSLFNGSFVQRSSRWKRKKGVVQFSKFLRAIQHQIGFFNGSGGEMDGRCSSSESFSTSDSQAAAEQDGLSSPSSTTVYISCNESSDTEENPNSQNQDGLEREIQESIQENEHLSSMVSASQQGYSKFPVPNQPVASCDCVMEVIETHESRKGREKGGLSAEEIGKLICKRVMGWGTTTSRSEARITVTELVYYDQSLDREEEEEEEEEEVWGDRSTQKMEIASGIADGILGDIRDEILAYMSINTSPCNKSY